MTISVPLRAPALINHTVPEPQRQFLALSKGVGHEAGRNADNIGRLLVGGSVLTLRLVTAPKVQAQNPRTSASLRGAFEYTFTGITGVDALAFAAVGRWLADGQGNFSGVETASSGGEIFQRT